MNPPTVLILNEVERNGVGLGVFNRVGRLHGTSKLSNALPPPILNDSWDDGAPLRLIAPALYGIPSAVSNQSVSGSMGSSVGQDVPRFVVG
eukprot:COSAG02_NODE_13048_length_1453_cov_1.526588_2_plen_91_part_00